MSPGIPAESRMRRRLIVADAPPTETVVSSVPDDGIAVSPERNCAMPGLGDHRRVHLRLLVGVGAELGAGPPEAEGESEAEQHDHEEDEREGGAALIDAKGHGQFSGVA